MKLAALVGSLLLAGTATAQADLSTQLRESPTQVVEELPAGIMHVGEHARDFRPASGAHALDELICNTATQHCYGAENGVVVSVYTIAEIGPADRPSPPFVRVNGEPREVQERFQRTSRGLEWSHAYVATIEDERQGALSRDWASGGIVWLSATPGGHQHSAYSLHGGGFIPGISGGCITLTDESINRLVRDLRPQARVNFVYDPVDWIQDDGQTILIAGPHEYRQRDTRTTAGRISEILGLDVRQAPVAVPGIYAVPHAARREPVRPSRPDTQDALAPWQVQLRRALAPDFRNPTFQDHDVTFEYVPQRQPASQTSVADHVRRATNGLCVLDRLSQESTGTVAFLRCGE